MKGTVFRFIHRGVIACASGPIVLALVYFILGQKNVLTHLTVNQVCIGIISISLLAFIVGGMNAIYQIERLPLALAILIHGAVLYIAYLGTYLINGWLVFGTMPILIFSVFFVVGYIIISTVIFTVTRLRTARINRRLLEMHRDSE